MLTVYLVDSLDDVVAEGDGMLTLREAVVAASTNAPVGDAPAGHPTQTDSIQFDSALTGGTITLSGAQLSIAGKTEIIGLGSSNLTIDADDLSRVFHIEGATISVQISGLTITGGAAEDGAGIYCDLESRGSLTLTDVAITGNTATGNDYAYGGGIYHRIGNLTITDSTVSGNSANATQGYGYAYGGGIYNEKGAVVIFNSTIANNSVVGLRASGGGIYTLTSSDMPGEMTLTDSTVSGNTAAYHGGGIFTSGGAGGDTVVELALFNSVVSGNSAGFYGGGIYANQGTLWFDQATLSSNTAIHSGGGIYCSSADRLALLNSVVAANSAGSALSSYGGGIYSTQSSLYVANSTIAGNGVSGSSHSYGGGIYSTGSSSELILANSIVALNSAPGDADISGQVATQGRNLIGVAPRFVANPSVGNPGDLHLTNVSPAVDTGDDAVALDPEGEPLEFDRDDVDRIAGARVDLGAYEFTDAVAPGRETPSTVVTTTDDAVDFYDGDISLREAVFYAGYDGLGDVVTFDAALAGGAIVLAGESVSIDWPLTVDAFALSDMTIDGDGLSRAFTTLSADEAQLIGLTLIGGAADDGAAVANWGTLAMVDCTVTLNVANTYGGAIYNAGALDVTSSIFTGNTAGYDGGAIYNVGDLGIANSLFSGNAADWYGGAVYVAGPATLTNATLAGNAAHKGGAIYRVAGELTLLNSIVTFNTAIYNPDIFGTLAGASAEGHNLIGTNPKFERNPSPGGDGAWGTPDDDYGNLRLQYDSAAVNAGDNDLALDPKGVPLTTDLDGWARILFEVVDIGAYEFVVIPGDATADGVVDAIDAAIVAGNWGESVSGGWLDGDFDSDGIVGPRDAAILAAHWGATLPSSGSSEGASEGSPAGESTMPAGAAPIGPAAGESANGRRRALVGPGRVASAAGTIAAAHDAALAEPYGSQLDPTILGRIGPAVSNTLARRSKGQNDSVHGQLADLLLMDR